MIKQSLALTERALRYDARIQHGHLLRLLVAVCVIGMLFIAVTVPNQVPGRFLMQGLMYGNAVLITVLAPIYFGNCITEEKEEKTLSLLVLANISPIALLGGKVFPRLLSIALILLVQIPFALLSITLGGVLLQQLFASYLALFGYLLAIAGFSTLMSVAFKRSSSAIGMAILGLFLFHVLSPLLWAIGPVVNAVGSTQVAGAIHDSGNWFAGLNVFFRLGVVTESTFAERWEMLVSKQFVFNCGFGLICLSLGLATFNWFNADPEAEVIRQKRSRLVGTTQRVWSWPVVWKEYYLIGGGHQMAFIKLIAYTLLIGGTAGAAWIGNGGPDGLIFGGWLAFMALALECQFLLASSLAFELKDRTWSSLATLPHNVSTLTYSKVAGAMLAMWPGLAWMALFFLIWLASIPFWISDFSFAGAAYVLIFVICGFVYVTLYLHLVAFYAVWSQNRWLAIIGAFFTTYVGQCVFYCVLAIPFMLLSGVGGGGGGDGVFALLVIGGLAMSIAIGIIALLHYRTLAMLTELQND